VNLKRPLRFACQAVAPRRLPKLLLCSFTRPGQAQCLGYRKAIAAAVLTAWAVVCWRSSRGESHNQALTWRLLNQGRAPAGSRLGAPAAGGAKR